MFWIISRSSHVPDFSVDRMSVDLDIVRHTDVSVQESRMTVEPMEITIVRDAISREALTEIAKQQFGDMVKAVVDVEQGVMAIAGELHSDEEAVLLDQGSAQRHLWGINLYPDKSINEWIEFDSMINVRPSGGNRSRYVESSDVREAITRIVSRLITG
jgi:hypothetical protein